MPGLNYQREWNLNDMFFSKIKVYLQSFSSASKWLILLAGLSLLPALVVRFFPVYDYPHWVYQAHIIANLQSFTDHFYISWLPVPNLGSTLPLLVLTPLLGAEMAVKVLVLINAFLFVIGYAYYIKGIDVNQIGLRYLGPVIVFNVFFFYGYLSFYLGLTIIVFTFGYLIRLTGPLTRKNIFNVALLSIIAYLCHLFIWLPIFLYTIISDLIERKTIKLSISQLPPLLLFFIYAVARVGQENMRVIPYNSILNKLFSLVGPLIPFQRIDPFPSKLPILLLNLFVMGLIALVIFMGLLKNKRDGTPSTCRGDSLMYTLALLTVMGIVFPFTTIAGMGMADQRLIFIAALLAFPLLMSCLKVEFAPKLTIFISIFVILVNLVSFIDTDKQLRVVDGAIKQIPHGKTIYTASFRNVPLYGECEPKLLNSGNGIFPLQWFPLYEFTERGDVVAETFSTAILKTKPNSQRQLYFGEFNTEQTQGAFLEKMNAENNTWDYVVIFRCPGKAIDVSPTWVLFDSGKYYDIYTKDVN